MPKVQKMGGLMVVAVVGSRTVTNCPELARRLDELLAAGLLDQLVSGGATGVDTLAAKWARANRVPLLELRPDYAAHGNAAPHVRNAAIVRQAARVLVVWDGVSSGTLGAARAAVRQGICCEWLLTPAPGAKPVPGGLGL